MFNRISSYFRLILVYFLSDLILSYHSLCKETTFRRITLKRLQIPRSQKVGPGPCTMETVPGILPHSTGTVHVHEDSVSLLSLQCSRHTGLLVARDLQSCQYSLNFLPVSHVIPAFTRLYVPCFFVSSHATFDHVEPTSNLLLVRIRLSFSLSDKSTATSSFQSLSTLASLSLLAKGHYLDKFARTFLRSYVDARLNKRLQKQNSNGQCNLRIDSTKREVYR